MIFVTVGTQLPFDRLIKMMDDIAPELGRPVIAQTGVGTYFCRNIQSSANYGPIEFDDYVKRCDILVAHAGMGTVLKAYKYRKPVILVPRKAALGEHRNDHQLATVSQLRSRIGIYVAETEEELRSLLARDLAPALQTDEMLERRVRLVDFVRKLIIMNEPAF